MKLRKSWAIKSAGLHNRHENWRRHVKSKKLEPIQNYSFSCIIYLMIMGICTKYVKKNRTKNSSRILMVFWFVCFHFQIRWVQLKSQNNSQVCFFLAIQKRPSYFKESQWSINNRSKCNHRSTTGCVDNEWFQGWASIPFFWQEQIDFANCWPIFCQIFRIFLVIWKTTGLTKKICCKALKKWPQLQGLQHISIHQSVWWLGCNSHD